MIYTFENETPQIPQSCFVAENATVIGQVTLGENVSVWYGAVLRADAAPILIGKNSNVQDCAVFHCDTGFPLTLGEGVTVGHSAIVHGATVGDNVLIGMHATLLNGCVIGENSIIAAGALVKEGQVVPPNSLAVGVPARIIPYVNEERAQQNRSTAQHYVEMGQRHKSACSPASL
ncbi:MAG: gamma carbonic anhydrase family protein [Firmicutes bacterium]|nr:gamma carbonic anhydrase family protein [Bacillota bacterium]